MTPKLGRKTLGDGLMAVVDDLTMNGRKAVAHTQRRIDKHILRRSARADTPATGYFNPDQRMSTLTTSDLTAYTAHRLKQGASAASCNHELATIRRAFRLAVRGGELVGMPHVPMLKLNNARQGFFERAEFHAILAHLPAYLHAPLKFAFVTGWRLRSEVLSMLINQVDLQAGVVRLEPGTTKNDDGRSFYVTAELREVLQAGRSPRRPAAAGRHLPVRVSSSGWLTDQGLPEDMAERVRISRTSGQTVSRLPAVGRAHT